MVKAIGGLTTDRCQVILRKFIEGVDNATATDVLSESINAVKALQHRASASLRRIPGQDGQISRVEFCDFLPVSLSPFSRYTDR